MNDHVLAPFVVPLESAGHTIKASRLSDHFDGWRLDVKRLVDAVWTDEMQSYADRCLGVARLRGRERLLLGRSSTSRDADFGWRKEHRVTVMDGHLVETHLPWLMNLYRGPFLALVNELYGPITGCEYRTPDDKSSAINVNLLPCGGTYEWHVDSNPVTGLLFCPTRPDDASELVFSSAPGTERPWWDIVNPVRGELLVFSANDVPHCVRNVTSDRVTVPMNFHTRRSAADRPKDLDRYLYG